MYRAVYVYTAGLDASVVAVVPTAICTITPSYEGYAGIQYLEVLVPDVDKDALISNNPATPVTQFSVSDGSGSQISRRVQSTIVDRVKAAQSSVNLARVGVDVLLKNAALNTVEELLGDLLDDLEQRPVDPGYPPEV